MVVSTGIIGIGIFFNETRWGTLKYLADLAVKKKISLNFRVCFQVFYKPGNRIFIF